MEKKRELKTQIPITEKELLIVNAPHTDEDVVMPLDAEIVVVEDKSSQEIIIDTIVEGKSAYDVAVERGFEGTIDDWINSLGGLQGDYNKLISKPMINSITIEGNKKLKDYGYDTLSNVELEELFGF